MSAKLPSDVNVKSTNRFLFIYDSRIGTLPVLDFAPQANGGDTNTWQALQLSNNLNDTLLNRLRQRFSQLLADLERYQPYAGHS